MKDLEKLFTSYKDLYETKQQITTLWRRKQPYFVVDLVNKKRALQTVKNHKLRKQRKLFRRVLIEDPYMFIRVPVNPKFNKP